MKIILLQDIPKVGKKYDVKEVANGLARNFLIPRKLAEMATPTALKKIGDEKEKREQFLAEQNKQLNALLEKLNNQKITIKTKATERGGLFAKITEKEIRKAIENQFKVTVPENIIVLKEPLKQVGEYEAYIQTPGKSILIKIAVESE